MPGASVLQPIRISSSVWGWMGLAWRIKSGEVVVALVLVVLKYTVDEEA